MTSPGFRVLLAVGLLATAGTVLATGDATSWDAVLQRPDRNGTVVVPDTFLRRWDPITVFYDADRGTPGPEDQPAAHVSLTPAHPGAWTWIDARTLQFRPAEPWPPLARYHVAAKGQSVDLNTLVPPPVRSTPAQGASGLGRVSSLDLVFPGPIEPDALAKMVTLELRELPGLGRARRTLDARDFTIKALDRTSADAEAVYTLLLDRPIELGTHVTVRIALAEEQTATSVADITFRTAEPFRVARVGCGSKTLPVSPSGTDFAPDQPLSCGRNGRVTVGFTARPAHLGPVEGRNLVRFEPAVDDLSWRLQGRRLVVSGDFERDRPYKVRIAPTPLTDTSGRALQLTEESSFWVHFDALPDYLRWSQADGIVEAHGPQTLPIEGRGHPRADLRVYAVDPLNRSFWPFPAEPVAVDEAARPPGPGEEAPPWTQPTPIPAKELASRLTQLGSPLTSTLVDLPVGGGAASAGLDLAPHLRGVGHYLVGLRPLDGPTTRSWVRVQVTDLSLTTVEEPEAVRFVVTSLSDGSPVSGATVRIEGDALDGKARVWTTLGTGRTDKRGVTVWDAPGADPKTSPRVRRVTVEHDGDTLVLDPQQAPEVFRDNHWKASSTDWLQWVYGRVEARGEPNRVLAHLFTERPVYRPGDTVHIKGYVRHRTRGRIEGRPGTGTVVVSGPSQSWRLPVERTANGDFYVAFTENTPATGSYTVRFTDEAERQIGHAVSFQIEAYELPRFEVDLHHPEHAALDAPFDVQLTGSYYAGGRVADRPVEWRVTQYPLTWSPTLPGFATSSDGRWTQQRFDTTPALHVQGRTDEDGVATLSLDPTVEPTGQPRIYVVEATVTGADDQTVTTTAHVDAVPPFVAGVKVPRWIERTDRVKAEVVAADPSGTLVPGKELVVRLEHRQWHSVLQASDFSTGEARWITDVVDVPVASKTVRSRSEPVPVRFPIDNAGVYVVTVETRDGMGRAQTVSVDLYAGGAGDVAWDKPKAGVFRLTTDEASYEPGETAHVAVHSPWRDGRALAIVETPQGNRYEALTIRNGTASLDLPVDRTWVPRIPVHVVLYRGRVGIPDGVTGLDLQRPQTLASTTWLRVEPVEHQISVALKHPTRARPGQTVPVTIDLKDHHGKPASGDVTLWLVDQAVLALGREQRLNPLPDFLPQRRAHTSVRDTRNLVLGRVPYFEMPGGDGMEEDEEGDPLDNATVRRNFQPVPVYEPAIRVDGRKAVHVTLSDDLTTFKVRAKVANTDQFGVAKGSIAVRLPVIVQPALPRFVRPSDRFEATGIGRIVEGDFGPGRATLSAQGLTTGTSTLSFAWDGGPRRLAFPAIVDLPADDEWPRDAHVGLTMKAIRDNDGAADAFAVNLPLRPHRRAVWDQEVVELDRGAPTTITGHDVLFTTDPDVIALAAGIDAVRGGPGLPGTTEQRITRARTLLAMARFRGSLGERAGQKTLDATVSEALDWLERTVDERGLVATWPGGRGRVWLTAQALHLVVEAREAGYPVDASVEAVLLRTLQASLRSDYAHFLDGESWLERVTALEALAASGRFEGSWWSELARQSRWLGQEGLARVLIAGDLAGQSETALAKELADELESSVLVRTHQGRRVYGGLRGRRAAHSPLILASEARAMALTARALHRVDPKSPRLPLLVEALTVQGRDGSWGSSNASGAALLALAEVIELTGDDVAVVLDGESVVLEAPVYRTLGGASVEVSATAPVFARVRRQTTPDTDDVEPAAHGFVVERAVQTAHTRGDVVEEQIRVVSPEERHFVAITVPLAAGFEPLNPRLRGAGPEATPSRRDTLQADWVEFLDDRVTYWFETLPAGTWDFAFRTKATTPGEFVQPPAWAEQLYRPTVRGNSAGARVVVQ